MLVPNDLYDLKRRIDRYLWDDDSLPLVRLREILSKNFLDFPDVAIVGGMVRDFARRGPDLFKSDIDLVIEAKSEDVAKLAARLGAAKNRFGGYAYQHPLWKVDFWALETTWAAKNGHVEVATVRDITRCTFFDCDSSAYGLKDKRVYALPNYLNKLKRRVIDINLRPNPSINGNLLRAIRRIMLWNLQPGPDLRDFIERHLNDESMRQISIAENSLYSNPIVQNYENSNMLLRQVNYRSGRDVLDASFGHQLELPFSSI